MLPRGIEFTRVLHLRQWLMGRKLLWIDTGNGARANISCRIYSNVSTRNDHNNYKKLQSCYHHIWSTTLCKRTYSKKDAKLQAAATAAADLASSTTNNTTQNVTTKTKTTKKTATEPKQSMKTANTSSSSSKSSSDAAAATSAKHAATAISQPKQTTKKLEIQTSKGILSITTTIEDSKINDVIFEKTKPQIIQSSSAAVTAEVDAIMKDSEKAATAAAATLKSTLLPESKNQIYVDNVKAATSLGVATATDTTSTAQSASQTPIPSATQTPPPSQSSPPPKPKRVLVDFNRSSLERNFITPARAMADFLLKAADLESLSKIKRRSPYEQEPPITVFWRKDVEAKAIEVWGSRENLIKESLKREIERKKHQQNIFTVKRRLRDYRREIGSRAVCLDDEPGLRGKSGKVVLIAIGINGINFLFKTCGWLYTGSHSMFAEAIHSLADTINQLILAYGIHKSTQMADSDHPYGYTNMKYVSSLISGVGIFCVGTGLSFYHGITGLMHPEPFDDFFWAFFILGGSLVSEGATLLVAMNEVRRSAKNQGISFKDYVLNGKDPCVNVVLTEDAAAVTSVILAAGCMGMTTLTGLPVFDAVGSLLVGSILGAVASFIIYTNVAALVGKSISEEHLNKINSELESDVMIRAIHDVKGIDMGNSLVRYKAEMDFDGRELTRSYLDKQDLSELLKVVKSFQTVEELERFLMNHGENIVDLMGGEIDRIEMKLRKKFPEIRHCDLEIL